MSRLEKLIAHMPENIDAVLVTSSVNQFYLTGFRYDDGYVVITRGKSYVFADSRYLEAAKNQVNSEFEVRQLKGKITEYMGDVFTAESVKTIGFENTVMTCSAFDSLKTNFPDMEFKPIGDIISNLREYKEPCEIADITAAQRIAELAFDHILGYISPDKTEIDIALELEFFMRKHGSQGNAFDIIAVSGGASALPHGVPRNCKLESGFLTMDYGAVVNGYRSDMTRTVCIGKPTDKMREIYDTVLNAQLTALDLIKEGVKCAAMDTSARSVITDAGYGDNFGHSLGHGVGLDIHERPGLHANAGDKLLAIGHVVTIEPGIYLEGEYGARIEDMVAITPDGAVNLTRPPKHLIEI
jgi:Xaa-Pro aminopeptidase